MTRQVVILGIVAILAGIVLGVAFGPDDGPDDRQRELEARVDSLRGELGEARRTLQVVDSVAAVEIRDARDRRARADTIFQNRVDTIRAHLPERFQPALDELIHADSVEDAAYEAEIAELHKRIEARDSVIAKLEANLRAQTELTEHLRDRLNPGFFEDLFDSTGPAVACGITTSGTVGCAAGVGISF